MVESNELFDTNKQIKNKFQKYVFLDSRPKSVVRSSDKCMERDNSRNDHFEHLLFDMCCALLYENKASE